MEIGGIDTGLDCLVRFLSTATTGHQALQYRLLWRNCTTKNRNHVAKQGRKNAIFLISPFDSSLIIWALSYERVT